MPENKADSTADAIKHFKGERHIDTFYSNRSGEIEHALRATCRSYQIPVNLVSPRTMQLLKGLCNMYWKELGQRYYEPGCRHAFGNMHASTIA